MNSSMDPFHEQRLRDEVLYLHSLWHQGPPRSNPNPYTNPKPNFNPHPYISRHLQPSNTTQFKNKNKIHRGKRGGKGKKRPPGSDPRWVSDVEWPCNPSPPETSSGWPTLNLKSNPITRVPTAEEQTRIFATQLQQKALKSAQEFFKNNADSDGDDNDEYGEVEDDDDDDMMDEDGCEEYTFFLKVFMEDSELRGYYEKNYESGEFCCLVCGGIGKKVGKRFKNCVALVQHSITIAKTKKRHAHRAYGQAICKTLGWDIDRLPTIVLAKPDDLQANAYDAGGKEDSNVCNSVNVDNIEVVMNKNSNASEVLSDKAVDLSNAVGGELTVCEHSLMEADGNKSMDDIENGVPSMAEGNEEGVVSCLCRNLTKRMVLEVVEMK